MKAPRLTVMTEMNSNGVRTTILAGSIYFAAAGCCLAQGLPGGASTLVETHGDWQVKCAVPDGSIICTASQSQVRSKDRQRVLLLELSATKDGNGATGTLVLPFGLELDRGVTLAVEDKEPFAEARFATCLPDGCLVPLVFDAAALEDIQTSETLKIGAVVNKTGQQITFPVSLSGLESALFRVAELSGS